MKNPDKEEYILYESISMQPEDSQNYSTITEARKSLLRERELNQLEKDMRELSEVKKTSQVLFCVVNAPVNKIIKTCQIEYLRFVHVIVCQLCINLKSTEFTLLLNLILLHL